LIADIAFFDYLAGRISAARCRRHCIDIAFSMPAIIADAAISLSQPLMMLSLYAG